MASEDIPCGLVTAVIVLFCRFLHVVFLSGQDGRVRLVNREAPLGELRGGGEAWDASLVPTEPLKEAGLNVNFTFNT